MPARSPAPPTEKRLNWGDPLAIKFRFWYSHRDGCHFAPEKKKRAVKTAAKLVQLVELCKVKWSGEVVITNAQSVFELRI